MHASTDLAGIARQARFTRKRAESLRRLASQTTGQLHAWLAQGAELEQHLAEVLQRHHDWLQERARIAREIQEQEPPPAPRDERHDRKPHPLDAWLRQALH